MQKKRWSVPTVLPADFEHAITGLFGRSRDVARFEKELTNLRSPLIAIVAKGGVGKTSLLLQVVSDFCLSTESAQHIDGVLWASFKQERLTASGIEILSAPASLADLEQVLCQEASEIFGDEFTEFGEMKHTLGSKRILLCLDNLESLLMDSPVAFNSFYEDLPEDWKVVVTSRIPVDSAKNIPLDVLDKPGAVALARAYLLSKGTQNVEQELLEKLSVGCNFNPLAIRLAIELYLSGVDLSSALQKTEKEVLSFSFKNLLEQLSAQENNILEAVFVLERPTRLQRGEVLSASDEDVASAISRLSKMSLVVRQESGSAETFTLGSSIRDLLRAYPRSLNVRKDVIDWLKKNRSSADPRDGGPLRQCPAFP